jgi:20S proteasome subunit beta 2
MDLPYIETLKVGGFNFDNALRNEAVMKQTGEDIKLTYTGTTNVGLVYKDGVVLASDTRATGGSIVGDKNCQKLHYLADNIYCAG